MAHQIIPLNLLTIAPENVRKSDGEADETLIASIRAHGLLQSLVVRPNLAAKGKRKGQPDGTFAVVAGGRRLDGLRRLSQGGEIPEDFGVGCEVTDQDGAAVSLAENLARRAMAPLDELTAYSAIIGRGQREEEVARQFGVTVLHVRQRLKLARVSPVIRVAFHDGRINLDTLKAYTVTDEHAAQEKVFRAGAGNNAYFIRGELTRDAMTADEGIVRFVGLDAYEAAGGVALRDLFGIADTRIQDPALMRRLAADRLQAEADALRADGWAWIEPADEIGWSLLQAHRKLAGEGAGLSEEAAAEAEALEEEAERLDPEDDADRCRQIEARLSEIGRLSLARAWTADQKAQAGGWIAIGFDGDLDMRLGYVRQNAPDDAQEVGELAETGGDEPEAANPSIVASAKPESEEPPGLSFPLIEDLTAHLTAALQAELVERPDLASLVLLHSLALDLFYPYGPDRSVNIRAQECRPEWHGSTTKGSAAAEHIRARFGSLQLRLPKEASDLWAYLAAADEAHRAEILAACVASTIVAVQKAGDRGEQLRDSRRRLHQARHIAGVIGLDMAKWWRPTAATYLGAVSKDLITEALTEAGEVRRGEKLAGAKKAELVALAEARLGPTTWLPALLRTERVGPMAEIADPDGIEDEAQDLAAE